MDIDVRKALTQSDSANNTRVTVNVWETDSPEIRAIMTQHFPRWAELFGKKNSEYGGGAAFELGQRGQFSDIYRKIIKLKRAMWDEDESVLTTESVDEILMDLIGHCFLTLEMRRRDRDEDLSVDIPPMTPEEFVKHVKDAGFFVLENLERATGVEAFDQPLAPGEMQLVDLPANEQPVQDDPMAVTDKDKDRVLAVISSDPNLWPKYRRKSDGSVFKIGDRVRLKQHLGKGQLLEVVNIESRGGYDILVQGEGEMAWVHPSWIFKDGEKSPEELALEASLAQRKPEFFGDNINRDAED